MIQKPAIVPETMLISKSYQEDYQEALVYTKIRQKTLEVTIKPVNNKAKTSKRVFEKLADYNNWVRQLRKNKTKTMEWKLIERHGLRRVCQEYNGTFKLI